MRDPTRIPRILRKIEILWNDNPDWRIAQLIMNAWAENGDPFHVEDDEIEAGLDRFLEAAASYDGLKRQEKEKK